MPSRNVRKPDAAESYYHIYARGNNKQPIFLDVTDYQYFISLFARYLSAEPQHDKTGVPYAHYRGSIELLAYCLMPNHFHLFVYQRDQSAMSGFMKSIMTSYGRYFNLKYKRTGSIYESTYKASLISTDAYLMHISRYIHLNPRRWRRYVFSSIAYYTGAKPPEWLTPRRVTNLFSSPRAYLQFLRDYEGRKSILDELKHELADI